MSTTTQPMRLQVTERWGWNPQGGGVYVGEGTRYHDSFRVYSDDPQALIRMGIAATEDDARAWAVERYRQWITGNLIDPDNQDLDELVRRWILSSARKLAGQNLMCWCPLPDDGQPDHCHAAVLMEIANSTN